MTRFSINASVNGSGRLAFRQGNPGGRVGVAAVAVTSLLLAAPVAAFEIDAFVIAPGGGAAEQGDWTLDATLGQPAVGSSQGGVFELRAGFWAAEFIVEPPIDAIFSDRFSDQNLTFVEEVNDAP